MDQQSIVADMNNTQQKQLLIKQLRQSIKTLAKLYINEDIANPKGLLESPYGQCCEHIALVVIYLEKNASAVTEANS